GPLLLSVTGTDGWLPFLAAGAILAGGAIPILIVRRIVPRASAAAAPPLSDILGYVRRDATPLAAVVLFGMIEFGAFALMPVWGLRLGLEEAVAIVLVAVLAFGNAVLQLPMGALIDRAPFRAVLAMGAVSAIVAGALLMGAWDIRAVLYATLFLLGGVVVSLYLVPLAELGRRYEGEALERGMGAVMMAYGLGALLGPPLMGKAMDLVPPHGVMWLMIGASVLFLLLLWARWRRGA
ncbi:MAG: MFS transporter, partial [Pseudomonadota bacterium]